MKGIQKYCSNLLNQFLIWKQRKHYHKSLSTLILADWWSVRESENYKYLCKVDIVKIKMFPLLKLFFNDIEFQIVDDNSKKTSLIFEGMLDEWIALGGLGEDQEEILELKKQWCKIRAKWLKDISNMDLKQDTIFIAAEIESIQKKASEMVGPTKEDALKQIAENLGSHVGERDLTAKEFFTYVNYYKEKR